MNKYKYLHLVWLIPIYFLLQFGYQGMNYRGIQSTYENGSSHIASVVDFDVKQIAAQTNGYVVLRFTDQQGETIQRQLSLPVQFAQVIMDSELIPLRYDPTSFRPIVLIPVYELQQDVLLVNIAVTLIGFLATVILSVYASKYANRKVRDGDQKVEYERIDSDDVIVEGQ
jgi:hypothetical protein